MTLDRLSSYLDKFGWRNHTRKDQEGEKEGYLCATWAKGPADNSFTLFVDPNEEMGLVTFTVPQIAFLPHGLNAEVRLRVLQEIAARNRHLPLGAYSHDPSDGEVNYRLTIPVISEDLTYPEFEMCLKVCSSAAEECGATVFGVLDDAGPKLVEEEPVDTSDPEQLFGLFQRFIEERKYRPKG